MAKTNYSMIGTAVILIIAVWAVGSSIQAGQQQTNMALGIGWYYGYTNPPDQSIPAFPYTYMRLVTDNITNATTSRELANPLSSADVSAFPSIAGDYAGTFGSIAVFSVNATYIVVGFHTAINLTTAAEMNITVLVILNSYLTPP